jgi:hypothetical protein
MWIVFPNVGQIAFEVNPMKWPIPFSRLLVLGLALLGIMACSPLDYFVLSRSSDQAPTPEIKQLPVTPVSQPPAPVASAAPSATLTPGSNGPQAGWKTYKSTQYAYVVSYPANWTIKVQTVGPTGPGRDPENVFLTSPGGGLPQVQIMALKGAPPITGFENCDKNLQFRGLSACSISQPGGQQPANQLLLFQKDGAYFHIGAQYEGQQQLGVFDEMMRSFQFTP